MTSMIDLEVPVALVLGAFSPWLTRRGYFEMSTLLK